MLAVSNTSPISRRAAALYLDGWSPRINRMDFRQVYFIIRDQHYKQEQCFQSSPLWLSARSSHLLAFLHAGEAVAVRGKTLNGWEGNTRTGTWRTARSWPASSICGNPLTNFWQRRGNSETSRLRVQYSWKEATDL